jgi:hypothetical protein
MIQNSHQLNITQCCVDNFNLVLAKMKQIDTSTFDYNDLIKHHLCIDAAQSQLDTLCSEIQEYINK